MDDLGVPTILGNLGNSPIMRVHPPVKIDPKQATRKGTVGDNANAKFLKAWTKRSSGHNGSHSDGYVPISCKSI